MNFKEYTEKCLRTAPTKDKVPEMHRRFLGHGGYDLMEKANRFLSHVEDIKKMVQRGKPYCEDRPIPPLSREKVLDPDNILAIHCILGIMGETMEMMHALLGENPEPMSAEWADCCYYMAVLAHECQVDPDKAMQDNISKLEKRFNIGDKAVNAMASLVSAMYKAGIMSSCDTEEK